jgi:hypothetical protein
MAYEELFMGLLKAEREEDVTGALATAGITVRHDFSESPNLVQNSLATTDAHLQN